MSLTAACGWALLRGMVIALLALPVCLGLARFLAGRSPAVRRLAWGLLLVPFLTPELVTGYGYSNFALSLVHHPHWKEVLYAVLIGMRIVPVGTAAVYFAPPSPLSPQALHCRRLTFRPSDGWLRRFALSFGFWLRGPLRRLVPAFLLMFLLTFQEFEIASLMWIDSSWTVWLFDAQVFGTFLSDSLRYALLPLACEAAVLVPGLFVLLRGRRRPSAPQTPLCAAPPFARFAVWSYLLIAATAVCVVPFTLASRGLVQGLAMLGTNDPLRQSMLREIAHSGTFALAAGLGAFALAWWLLGTEPREETRFPKETGFLERAPHGPWPVGLGVRAVMALALSAWGLCGSLIVSLSILALFQQPGLYVLYDTPLPLVAALVLYLLPRVLLLQVLLLALRPREAVHLALLLKDSPSPGQRQRGRELLWRLRQRGPFWLAALACYWAYLDLTAAALLAPVDMVTAPARLYNLMHYSPSGALSAMTVLVVAAPVLAVLLVAALRRPLLRLCVR